MVTIPKDEFQNWKLFPTTFFINISAAVTFFLGKAKKIIISQLSFG